MSKHYNPYRINDPKNLFEVGENSSHPELEDTKRIWEFNGHIMRSATEVEKYFNNEGLDPRKYWILPTWEKDGANMVVRIKIVQRVSPEERKNVRELAL